MIKVKKKNVDTRMLVAQEREHILSQDTDFFIRESYNTLRSNITFSLTEKGCKIIAVTSTNPGEGKSITAMNIAVAYAEINKKVLLIDCDLRKPKVHRLLQVKPTPGLSNILIDESEPQATIQTIDKYGIDAITSGDIPPNSTQLLESEHLEKLLTFVKSRYDYVILDTPPINIVIDACILAKHTSGIVYVIKQDYAKKDNIINAVRQLEFSQGSIIGFVLNDISDKSILNLPYNNKYAKNRYGRYKYEYKTKTSDSGEKTAEATGDEEVKLQRAKTFYETVRDKIAALIKGRTKKKKGKRRRHKVLMILLIVLVLICGTIIGIAKYQENNIQALSYAGKYSGEELAQKNAELEWQIQGIAQQLPEVYIKPLTEEERHSLATGEITREQAAAIITGVYRPTPEPEYDEDGEIIQPEVSEETVAPQVQPSKTNELVAEFYLLKAEFLNSIDNLIAQGQAERQTIPKEDRTLSVKLDMAKKYAKLGSELESQCDKRVETLLKEFKKELKATGQSTSVVGEIEKLYNEEKAVKKAALIEAYYPKG